MTRVYTSRPDGSVPKRWGHGGGAKEWARLIVSGEPLASHDGKIAAMAMKITNATESQTPGRNVARRFGRVVTSMPGPTDSASVRDVTTRLSRSRGTVSSQKPDSRGPHPGVGDEIEDVDEQVRHD